MSRVGGLTHKFYRESRGMKVSGGQFVKAGTIITREGHRWKPGRNVIGQNHLNAACDGTVYFTRKKGNYNRVVTTVHVRPVAAPKASKTKSK